MQYLPFQMFCAFKVTIFEIRFQWNLGSANLMVVTNLPSSLLSWDFGFSHLKHENYNYKMACFDVDSR